jgi:hypothetical protein
MDCQAPEARTAYHAQATGADGFRKLGLQKQHGRPLRQHRLACANIARRDQASAASVSQRLYHGPHLQPEHTGDGNTLQNLLERCMTDERRR